MRVCHEVTLWTLRLHVGSERVCSQGPGSSGNGTEARPKEQARDGRTAQAHRSHCSRMSAVFKDKEKDHCQHSYLSPFSTLTAMVDLLLRNSLPTVGINV
jgi:hypothetical protein